MHLPTHLFEQKAFRYDTDEFALSRTAARLLLGALDRHACTGDGDGEDGGFDVMPGGH